ncbi:hypothetical protein ACIBF5_23275 [Micromonospora sp. NPDC050417]|uniref:hypothetical protein n=1 Tax=Micromonospora sp. NPDC050417 TaxID=3364280 RepID=UPI0037A3066B
MALLRTLLSPLLFGLVGLTFLLPFATVTVQADRVRLDQTWSGLDLLGGARGEYRLAFDDYDGTRVVLRGEEFGRLEAAPLPDPDEGLFVPRQPALMVALVGILVGVLGGLVGRPETRRLISSVAATGTIGALTIGLLLVSRRLAGQYDDHPPYLSFPPGSGYWWAAGLLVALSLGNAVAPYLRGRRRQAIEPEEAVSPTSGEPGA